MDLAFYFFGERIKRKLASLDLRPKGFDGMKYAFIGTDGKVYYSYQDIGDLPAMRTKRLEEYMIWIDAGVTKKSLEEFIDDLSTKLLNDVLRAKSDGDRSKACANIMALGKEMLLRGKDIIPEELYYNIAAVTIAREDEDPRGLDDTIHDMKVKMLRDAGRKGAPDFFFRMPAFRGLFKALLTSEEGLNELLTNWMVQRHRRKVAREVLLSANA